MKSHFRIFGFLLAVCMTFSLLGCVATPTESSSEPSVSSENVKRINEMIGKLESAAATATTNLNDSVTVLTADFEAKQKDSEDVVAQMNAAHTARTAALAAQIQTLKNVDTNNTEAVAAAIAEAEALISEERHVYGDPIEHSRTSDCSSCDEKDIYQICTMCNALKWGKLAHTLQMFRDEKIHWQVCARCGLELPEAGHTANAEGECTECRYTVNVNILIIEKYDGESETLCGMIDGRHTVSVLNVDDAPATVEALAQYDEVILVNVAYADMPAGFEEVLHRYVYDMGGGVLTVGGRNDMINGQLLPHAYNRNDMAHSTYYKEMLPVNVVDFSAPMAVMLVIDASASMSMGKLDVAKNAALGILDTLGAKDYCGVVEMIAQSQVILEPVSASDIMAISNTISEVGQDGAHGGTIFSDAIQKAGEELAAIEGVETKHIILISDGNPGDSYAQYSRYIEEVSAKGITTSIISIGVDSESNATAMQNAADLGGGKYIDVSCEEMNNAFFLSREEFPPEIMAEIRYGQAMDMQIGDVTFVVEGIDPVLLPALTGCYAVEKKEGAMSPLESRWLPVYAQWQYGKGSVGSFMCDLNGIWSADFVASEPGATIINNIISVLANTLAEENSQNEQQ